MNRLFARAGAAGLVVMLYGAAAVAQQALSTEFTYQGQLKLSGAPLNDTADLEVTLFDTLSGGTPIAAVLQVNNVVVVDGLFTVSLDFGTPAFDGNQRFLEFAVRSPAGSGVFTTLSPRQPLTAVPYALYALSGPGNGGPWEVSGNNVFNTNTGNVGIGTNAPVSPLHIAADAAALRLQGDDDAASYSLLEDFQAGIMRLMKFTGVPGGSFIDFDPMPSDGAGDAIVRVFRATNTTGIKAMLFYRGNNTNEPSAAIAADGDNSWFQLNGGNVGIGTPTPLSKLHVEGGIRGVGGVDIIHGSNPGGSVSLSFGQDLDNVDVARIRIGGSGTGAQGGFDIQRQGNASLLRILHDGRVGIGTLSPQAKLDVNGTARANIVEITGADLAEKFPASEKLEPGMVVAIDPTNAGKLCVARGAYNQCVAGVVSGANNFTAGAVLGNLPGQEDAPAVALSGRVYVHCDASTGAIQPGDMLTTSDTSGYAMKAVDRERSQGAVIGKAMTSLESGRGMVLVLVSLQ